MKLNRRVLMVLALVMSLAMATTGTLAYLTDTDAIENTFTFGNVDIELEEDFEQGSELIPDVDVEKAVTIKNTGSNDAWVWFTYAVPTALVDQGDNASKNAIHFNVPGRFWDTYRENSYYWEAGQTEAAALEDTWHYQNIQHNLELYDDGVGYTVVTWLYNGALAKGETTNMGLEKVYLDKHVDITPEGDMYWVEKGVATDLNWNIKEDGAPKIYVNAYAIQKDEFDTVADAYKAYMAQWSADGESYTKDMVNAGLIEIGGGAGEGGEEEKANGDDESVTFEAPEGVHEVANSTELAAAVAEGHTAIKLADGVYDIANCGGKELSLYGSKNAVLKVMNEGEDGCDYGFGAAGTGVGHITFNGLTIDTTSNTGNYKGYAYMGATFNDCSFVGSYSLNNKNTFEFNYCDFDFNNGYFWTWGAEKATFNNCDFNGNSKCILAHGWESTEITINNCKFAATEKGYTGAGDNTACVEIDPAGTNTYTINFTGYNTKTESYAGWTRVKDGSTGHTITGLE